MTDHSTNYLRVAASFRQSRSRGPVSLLKMLTEALRGYFRLRADIHHVSQLDADRLRDLGIARDEIEETLCTGYGPRRSGEE